MTICDEMAQRAHASIGASGYEEGGEFPIFRLAGPENRFDEFRSLSAGWDRSRNAVGNLTLMGPPPDRPFRTLGDDEIGIIRQDFSRRIESLQLAELLQTEDPGRRFVLQVPLRWPMIWRYTTSVETLGGVPVVGPGGAVTGSVLSNLSEVEFSVRRRIDTMSAQPLGVDEVSQRAAVAAIGLFGPEAVPEFVHRFGYFELDARSLQDVLRPAHVFSVRSQFQDDEDSLSGTRVVFIVPAAETDDLSLDEGFGEWLVY